MAAVPQVKICGLCRPADAAAAVAAGAAYVGVILTSGHRRSRTLEEAAAIYGAATGARRVGVFVDAPEHDVLEAARALRLDVLQLHGAESAAQVAALAGAGPWQVWKALRPRTVAELEEGVATYGAVAAALLVDGYDPAAAGGTGAPFPAAAAAVARRGLPAGVRFVAAGGLTPANVAAIVAAVAPDIVDVSSGVESAPCTKDPDRMHAFVTRARSAGTSLTRAEGAV